MGEDEDAPEDELKYLPALWRWTYESYWRLALSVALVMVVAYLGRVGFEYLEGNPRPWTGGSFVTAVVFGLVSAVAAWWGHPLRRRG
ncbi:hypothetical protein GCM10017786_34770 [Amycolatopsis deserti]|uniref:Uncharacterized protein n=1 Tax=Amycolatopsis deserti TaxID=185696 RepID=A0ABQ3J0Q0_9PSEU|nr:hypothetical protein [Amycolatopsis deserti]GHE98846.1 hypothetical protein GCM10017786_34770 [Amycolatopsis deserti]